MRFSTLLDELGVKSLPTLEERIIFQKKLYFLQDLFGAFSRRYHFSWFIYGPYSSQAAKDAFSFIEIAEDFELDVDDKKLKQLQELDALIGTDAKRWEMAASIHYRRQQSPDISRDELFEELSKKWAYLADRAMFDEMWDLIEKKSNGLSREE